MDVGEEHPVEENRLKRCACWFDINQTASINSLEVEKGCTIGMLRKSASVSIREQVILD